MKYLQAMLIRKQPPDFYLELTRELVRTFELHPAPWPYPLATSLEYLQAMLICKQPPDFYLELTRELVRTFELHPAPWPYPLATSLGFVFTIRPSLPVL